MGRSLQIDLVSFEMMVCPWLVRYSGLAVVLDVPGPDAVVGTGGAIVAGHDHSSLLQRNRTEVKRKDLDWWITQCSYEKEEST